MDESNKKPDDSAGSSIDTTSTDALSSSAGGVQPAPGEQQDGGKKKRSLLPAPLRKFSHRFNIYLLFFVLILVVAAAVLVITAMASKTQKDPTTIGSQSLSSNALKQLNGTSTTVGDPKQVLNVQSNAIFSGQVLIKDTLEVAGQVKIGSPLSLPGITVSGLSNFDQLNVNRSINVGGDADLQGQVNVKKNLAVSGSGTFGGTVTAPVISTGNFQLLGDLQLTRHIDAGGGTPSRNVGGAVGSGGTASISGSDTAGSVNINTGSSPGAGCFVTINFAVPFGATPHVLITPIGSDAGAVAYYVNRNTTSFSICSSNNPPANTSFGFDYFVVD